MNRTITHAAAWHCLALAAMLVLSGCGVAVPVSVQFHDAEC